MHDLDTIIVGAGITGLAAAHRLQAAGQTVLVLEASHRVGDGRIVRVERNGDMANGGAQLIHTNYDEMLRLVDAVGLRGDLIKGGGKTLYLDAAGAPRITGGHMGLAGVMGARGAAEAAAFYGRTRFSKSFPLFEITKDIPEYDNTTAAEAYAKASRAFLDYVLRPMMHATTNTVPAATNLYHTLNLLKLVTTTETYGLRTGIVTLLERIASGLDVRFGAKVATLLMTGERVDGVELEDGTRLGARHVIVACPLGAAGELVPEALGQARKFLQGFPYTPLPLVFFFLDRPIADDVFVYFGHPFRETPYNMAVNHAGRREMVPSGKAIISTWAAYPSTVSMSEMSDTDTIAQALADLDAFIPGVAGFVEEAPVMKHRRGIARYALGTHRKILDFKAYAKSLPGVSFAGNDYDSVHMESGVRSAYRAAARALQT